MRVNATVSYEKLHEIGIGQGMNSKVYLATDAQFSGDIAVKEIPKTTFGNTVADYYREAERMFSAAHQNVVPVHYAGEASDCICIAMPYFGRGSLQTRIENGPLSVAETMRVAQGFLTGLARVHAAGLLHLDAKPTNLLFDDRDPPLLADFGQSRRVSATGVVNVPALYSRVMPPETLHTGIATFRSDIYQAGLLLYRVANGEPHYQGQVAQISLGTLDRQIVRGKFPDRSSFQPHVPPRLRTAIRKALRIDPAERFDSATDLADELARIPVALNWVMSFGPGGIHEWRAGRQGRGDLLVRRIPRAPGTFDVQVFTNSTAGLRAKGRADLWKKQVGTVEATEHLTTVFAELSA